MQYFTIFIVRNHRKLFLKTELETAYEPEFHSW